MYTQTNTHGKVAKIQPPPWQQHLGLKIKNRSNTQVSVDTNLLVNTVLWKVCPKLSQSRYHPSAIKVNQYTTHLALNATQGHKLSYPTSCQFSAAQGHKCSYPTSCQFSALNTTQGHERNLSIYQLSTINLLLIIRISKRTRSTRLQSRKISTG